MKYCGKEFSNRDIKRICEIIEQKPVGKRTEISRLVCKELNWNKPDGKFKEMSCRIALLRMEKDGFIKLPP